jgi:hypothetical protein
MKSLITAIHAIDTEFGRNFKVDVICPTAVIKKKGEFFPHYNLTFVVRYSERYKTWYASLGEVVTLTNDEVGCVIAARKNVEEQIEALKSYADLIELQAQFDLATKEEIKGGEACRAKAKELKEATQYGNFIPCNFCANTVCKKEGLMYAPVVRVSPESGLGATWELAAHVAGIIARWDHYDESSSYNCGYCRNCVHSTVLKEANDPEDVDPVTGVATISEGQEIIHKSAVGAGANPHKKNLREKDPNIRCDVGHHTASSVPDGDTYEGQIKETSCPDYFYKASKAWKRSKNSVQSINPLSVSVMDESSFETNLVIAKCIF